MTAEYANYIIKGVEEGWLNCDNDICKKANAFLDLISNKNK